MREVSFSPDLVGIRRGCVARRRRCSEGTMLIRIGASLREPHPLVQAGRPERFEGKVLGAHGGVASALAASRSRSVFPPVPDGGEHSLGTLKDAAHTRAASLAAAPNATTLLLRLRPPGTDALQATYCDRAFDLVPGLDPFFWEEMTTLPVVGSSCLFSFSRPCRPNQLFKAGPSSLSPFCAFANVSSIVNRWD